MTVEQDREYRYRRLVPMSHEQYLDEPDHTIEWTLRLAQSRGDEPWNGPPQPRRR